MNLLDRIAYDTGGYTVQEILSSFCNKILEIIELVNKNEEVCDEAHAIIENIRNEVVPRLVDDIIKEMKNNGYFDNLVNVTLFKQLRTELTRLLNQTITDYTTRLNNFDSQLDTKASKIDLAKESARIDLLTKIEGGQTEGNSELLDLRVSNDGITYETVGKSVRTQFNNVENLILTGEKELYYDSWTTGSILSNGTLVTQAKSYMYVNELKSSCSRTLKIKTINNFAVAVAQYDSNKTFVSRTEYIKGESIIKLSQPYYRVSFGLTESESRQVTKEDLVNITIYDDIETLSDKQNNLLENTVIDSFKNGKWSKEKNDYLWMQGAIASDGSTNGVESYITTLDFYSAKNGITFELETLAPYAIAFAKYDSNKKFISRTLFAQKHTILNDSAYYKLCFGLTNGVTPVSTSDLCNLTVKEVQIINSNFNNSKLFGKSVYSFGDSLLYGHYSGEGFLDGLVNECNMNYTKCAINGAEVIQNIINQINNAPSTEPDFIVLDGMVNDATKDITARLGELTPLDVFESPSIQNTFYGSLEHIFYTLRNKYPNAKIIYVIPHLMPTRPIARQKTLAEAIIKTCKKWAIPVVNIQEEGQINTFLDSYRNKYSYNNLGETSNGNGTHLTGVGYDEFYKPMIKAKMIELI